MGLFSCLIVRRFRARPDAWPLASTSGCLTPTAGNSLATETRDGASRGGSPLGWASLRSNELHVGGAGSPGRASDHSLPSRQSLRHPNRAMTVALDATHAAERQAEA